MRQELSVALASTMDALMQVPGTQLQHIESTLRQLLADLKAANLEVLAELDDLIEEAAIAKAECRAFDPGRHNDEPHYDKSLYEEYDELLYNESNNPLYDPLAVNPTLEERIIILSYSVSHHYHYYGVVCTDIDKLHEKLCNEFSVLYPDRAIPEISDEKYEMSF